MTWALDTPDKVRAEIELLYRHKIGPNWRVQYGSDIDILKRKEAILTQRRFELPSNYGSFDAFIRDALTMHHTWYMDRFSANGPSLERKIDKAIADSLYNWSESTGPLIALSKELIEDLESTQAPEDTTYSELEHPYPTYILAVPENTILSGPGNSNSVLFILVEWYPKGRILSPVTHGVAPDLKYSTFHNSTLGMFHDESIRSAYEKVMKGEEVVTDQNFIRLVMSTPGHRYHIIRSPESDMQLSDIMKDRVSDNEESTKWIQRIFNLVCSVSLYLSAKPDDNQDEVFIRNVSRPGFLAREQLPKSALWRPRRLGEKYAAKIRSEKEHNSRSPRMHIRRKHWRRQVHGEGRRLRKWIQVERALINGPKPNEGKQ
jgi:hypothetical protein